MPARRVDAAPHRGRGHDTVLLPLFPGLTDDAQDHVIDRLADHASVEVG